MKQPFGLFFFLLSINLFGAPQEIPYILQTGPTEISYIPTSPVQAIDGWSGMYLGKSDRFWVVFTRSPYLIKSKGNLVTVLGQKWTEAEDTVKVSKTDSSYYAILFPEQGTDENGTWIIFVPPSWGAEKRALCWQEFHKQAKALGSGLNLRSSPVLPAVLRLPATN